MSVVNGEVGNKTLVLSRMCVQSITKALLKYGVHGFGYLQNSSFSHTTYILIFLPV